MRLGIAMNRERILAILYDLVMVIGGEVRLQPLLTKTLQRLLYHTSFPVGAVFLKVTPLAEGQAEAHLDMVIGDHQLSESIGRTFSLPGALFSGGMALVEDIALIESLPCRKGKYTIFLRLPIDGEGFILLFSPPLLPGSELPLEGIFQPVMGNLAKAILLCRRNEEYTSSLISDRDRARSGLERFRAALDASSDAVFLIDPATMRFVDFNRSAESFSGYGRGELLQIGLQDLIQNQENNRDNREPGSEQLLLMRQLELLAKGHDLPLDLDATLQRKDGATVLVSIRLNLFAHASGDRLVIAIARDITVRKQLEMELLSLNESLERRVELEVAKNREKDLLLIQQSRLAAMGEMVHNIAHQWRQPLNGLSVLLSCIQEDVEGHYASPADLHKDIKQAHELLQKMSTTIDEFRDFFRPDHEAVEFDLKDSVEDAFFVIEAALRNSSIKVDKVVVQSIRTEGFSNQFAQVILNILANAKEAIQREKTDHGRIWIRLEKRGDEAILSIEDTGGGIPEKILPKIFDPYFTTKPHGSGIGLYMSRMIIERNFNGKIEASNAAEGAVITVRIPLVRKRALSGPDHDQNAGERDRIMVDPGEDG